MSSPFLKQNQCFILIFAGTGMVYVQYFLQRTDRIVSTPFLSCKRYLNCEVCLLLFLSFMSSPGYIWHLSCLMFLGCTNPYRNSSHIYSLKTLLKYFRCSWQIRNSLTGVLPNKKRMESRITIHEIYVYKAIRRTKLLTPGS